MALKLYPFAQIVLLFHLLIITIYQNIRPLNQHITVWSLASYGWRQEEAIYLYQHAASIAIPEPDTSSYLPGMTREKNRCQPALIIHLNISLRIFPAVDLINLLIISHRISRLNLQMGIPPGSDFPWILQFSEVYHVQIICFR